jgi:hypothetical protein
MCGTAQFRFKLHFAKASSAKVKPRPAFEDSGKAKAAQAV